MGGALHTDFSKVCNIVCILKVLPESLGVVGAGGCQQRRY